MRLVDIDDIRVMKFLSEEDDPSESDGEREYRNGWNDALTAINDIQPSAEPVRKPDEWCTDCKEYDHDKHCCPRFNRVIKSALKDAEPRKGEWIPIQRGFFNKEVTQVKCDQCGNLLDLIGVNCGRGDANYCPNCGASMSEGEQDD